MFFQNLKKLLEGAQAVTVIIVPADEGRIAVTLTPKLGEKADPTLARPMSFVGTAEELDAEWGNLIGGLATARRSLAEQLAAVQAEMDAAKKAATKKAAAPAKTVPPAKPAAVSIDDLVPDDESGTDNNDGDDEGDAPTAPAAAPAAAPAEQPAAKQDAHAGGLDLASLL